MTCRSEGNRSRTERMAGSADGWTTATRGRTARSRLESSSTHESGSSGTATAPARPAPSHASRNSGRFSTTSATRSPARPARANQPAVRSTASATCPRENVFPAKRRKGRPGSAAAAASNISGSEFAIGETSRARDALHVSYRRSSFSKTAALLPCGFEHSDHEDRGSGRLAGLQVAVRLRRLLQLVALVDLDLDAACSHVPEELGGKLFLLGRVDDVVGERGPRHVERALHRQDLRVEGRDEPRGGAHAHQQSAAPERVEGGLEGGLPHAVKDHRDAGAGGDLADALRHVLVRVVDGVRAAVR